MRRFIFAAVLAVGLVLPVGVTAAGMGPIEANLRANVATMQKYVDNYFAVLEKRKLTVKQEAALAHDLDTLARNKRALAAYLGSYHEPEVLAVLVGPAPLPNDALASDTTYGCAEGFDAAAFEAKYGFSIQTAFDRVATGILRPNLDRWQTLIVSSGGTFTQENADYYKRGDVMKQQAMIDYFAGRIPFSRVAGYFGGWSQYLGCEVDIGAIHDLGAD